MLCAIGSVASARARKKTDVPPSNLAYTINTAVGPYAITLTWRSANMKNSVGQRYVITTVPETVQISTINTTCNLNLDYAIDYTVQIYATNDAGNKTSTSTIIVNIADPISSMTVFTSFSAIYFKWSPTNNSGILSQASSSSQLTVELTKQDGTTITTRYMLYARFGSGFTTLTAKNSISNQAKLQASITTTSSATAMSAMSELALTGLSANTKYLLLLKIPKPTAGEFYVRYVYVNTPAYESNEVPPSLFKFTPWTDTSTAKYSYQLTSSSTLTGFTHNSATGKAFFVAREGVDTATFMNSPYNTNFPDQTARATISSTDYGAMCFGLQKNVAVKTTSNFYFTRSTKYVLTCFTIVRSVSGGANDFKIFLDPNASDESNTIELFYVTPSYSTTAWLANKVEITTTDAFTNGNYYVRLAGFKTVDLIIFISNLEIVKIT